ncbi:MAG: hypothetical protein NZO58_11735 [Gemmataceae bacterium]|nr:hypothetical protein [Gemmataceae bacterium]
MGRLCQLGSTAMLLLAAGCHSSAQLCEVAPILPHGAVYVVDQNPVFLPHGPESYGLVFESVLQVLGDYGFEIREANRYDGRIETLPRIAPGLGLFLKPGSPDVRDRLLATLQTYRHRVLAEIQPAENGGFFVRFTAVKELEDLPRPIRSTVGAAVFRPDNTIDRQFEVIDATTYDSGWIFRGRDEGLEQELIRRLKKCL